MWIESGASAERQAITAPAIKLGMDITAANFPNWLRYANRQWCMEFNTFDSRFGIDGNKALENDKENSL